MMSQIEKAELLKWKDHSQDIFTKELSGLLEWRKLVK